MILKVIRKSRQRPEKNRKTVFVMSNLLKLGKPNRLLIKQIKIFFKMFPQENRGILLLELNYDRKINGWTVRAWIS